MGFLRSTLPLLLAVGLLAPAAARGAGAPAGKSEIEVPAGINHGSYDRLLKKHVDGRGLVNYAAWKGSAADVAALDGYLAQFRRPAAAGLSTNEKAAALTNAYNAMAMRTILANYPVESILATKHPLTAKRWEIGGQKVSLNDIENKGVRPLIGWRAHSVLVCVARSCPPLRREAYTATGFTRQDDAAFRAWLARPDLNRFHPGERRIELSKVFKWFRKDFDAAGGVTKLITPYVPAEHRRFFASGDYKTEFLPYNFGLNDQGPLGRDYGTGNAVGDVLRNLF